MDKDAAIYVTDHDGYLGAAVVSKLREVGYSNLVLAPRSELDLKDSRAVVAFFRTVKPSYVFLTAQKSGGISANISHPADFIYENLAIQQSVFSAAREGVRRIIFLGASCIYPKDAPQPIKEEYFLTGPLEEASKAYAIAKIAGVLTCDSYAKQYGLDCVSLVPATVYGPGGSFDAENAHVLGALIQRFHEAKVKGEREVIVWGSGEPRREFIYVDDLAEAAMLLMERSLPQPLINVGVGHDISISDLALLIKGVVGFSGEILFDGTKPDGVMQKLLDSGTIRNLGWKPRVSLEEGIVRTYNWYRTQHG